MKITRTRSVRTRNSRRIRTRKAFKPRKRKNVFVDALYPVLPSKARREAGKKYIYRGEIRIWDGINLKCEHGKQKALCKKCDVF